MSNPKSPQDYPTRPNLFHFATSELSQDAFLAWLISWADPRYKKIDSALHQLAQAFVRRLLGKHQVKEITSVFVKTQWNKIDVSATINNQYFLLIEDKTGTREHSGQLIRYKESAEAFFKTENIKRTLVPIYFKLQEQSDLSGVTDEKYHLFGREEMLACLEPYVKEATSLPKNQILVDYYKHIQWLDREINSYTTRPMEDWGKEEVQVAHTERKEVLVTNGYAWHGFFAKLQQALAAETDEKGLLGWGYVSNAKGGFMGLWWYPFESRRYYIQLEENTLTFRLTAKHDPPSSQFRKDCKAKLEFQAKERKIELAKFGRRAGKTSGLANLAGDYMAVDKVEGKRILNLEKTIQTIKKMKTLLEGLQPK